jgi:hypothetical protein
MDAVILSQFITFSFLPTENFITMSKAFIINVILAFNIYNALCIDVDVDEKILSRRKRFVLFPTGSSFSVATCMTVGGKRIEV